MRLVEADELAPTEIAAVERIYRDAFPQELLAPFPDLFADRMLVLLDEDGPAGLALVRDLAGTTWTFLRYYAVGRRGRGTGSAMWGELTRLLTEEGRTRLVWDVEDPDEEGIPDESVVEHRRRIVFYERLGGRLLPVHEYHPPHDDGHEPQLRLMDVPLGAGDRAGLRELVEGVYWLRYGADPDHPSVRRTLLASNLI
ncbi:GNAT family N-acetyltransferase [Nocardioides mangrovi]|uniref:GNAT family N-acetyltransferase n=1 Tax=Nocardioides mangrovi TaxID=2874580 RepID=A0ABS7UGY7_9ACTN|nr:GNAT family N-acetyltransferase [Nocardioides mangrovi]MBZ5739857.1 GNAT family N-acetyltransferase [Nocardioides mangrovi]